MEGRVVEKIDAARMVQPLGLAPSFGFGDRTGLATPGHAAALRAAGGEIRPVLAQQSIREMARTGRSPQAVMNDALAGVAEAGYAGPIGADADHVKTRLDVERTAAAGFRLFTLDPSDELRSDGAGLDDRALAGRPIEHPAEADWPKRYAGTRIPLDTGTVLEVDEATCRRAAIKYGPAVDHALALASHVDGVMAQIGRPYELELSVDETPGPTSLAEHYMIADRCRERGMGQLVSLAPRFADGLEKAIDHPGDPAALERAFRDHAAIARRLGPYKLSLHSGSDKLSAYPALARATEGAFHVKTAGTSYLEALRVAARRAPELFRRIVGLARERYETERATYAVSASLAGVEAPAAGEGAADLERRYLGAWDEVPAGHGMSRPGRQILHCTFGAVITDPTLGPALHETLRGNAELYRELLEDHFARHLGALQ